jgi:hypothetical protein
VAGVVPLPLRRFYCKRSLLVDAASQQQSDAIRDEKAAKLTDGISAVRGSIERGSRELRGSRSSSQTAASGGAHTLPGRRCRRLGASASARSRQTVRVPRDPMLGSGPLVVPLFHGYHRRIHGDRWREGFGRGPRGEFGECE